MIELTGLTKKTVLVIAGPTGSGKSGLALELAKQYNGVVINADSMQIYQETPILSAAPTDADKQQVPHLLYEIFPASKRGAVSEWVQLAVEAVRNTWKEGKLPILVGGTGFYLESLIAGVSPIPETPPKVKKQVAELFEKGGVAFCYSTLQKEDPRGAARVWPTDTTRVRRALEIFRATGKSIADWFELPMVKPLAEADFRIIALLPALSELEDKCNKRFDEMMDKGALKEVERLMSVGLEESLPAMKAIGVPELSKYLQGHCSLEEAVSLAKLHTRQYAKRQLTWFRNRLKKLPATFLQRE